MHVRTLGALVGVTALLALTGCGTVSRDGYLNTAYGPGKSPETYRVGGVAPQSETETRVVVVRSADLEVAGMGSTASHSTAVPALGAAPAGGTTPMPVPPAPTSPSAPLGGMPAANPPPR